METKRALIMMGGNLGPVHDHFDFVLANIEYDCGKLVKTSSRYKTEPWGLKDQPHFINQAFILESSLQPLDLIAGFQKLEDRIGHDKTSKWGARRLDLDIIFYSDWILKTKDLEVPHPLMQERNFVLVPSDEIAPDWIHPVFKKSVHTLLLNSDDDAEVLRMT